MVGGTLKFRPAVAARALLLAASIVPASIAIAGPSPVGAGHSLAVAVSGFISPRCTVDATRGANASFGDILDPKTGRAAPLALDLPFSMNCNTPFTAALMSKNGGLAYVGNPQSNFARTVVYSARLGMDGIAGGVSLQCDSTNMSAAAIEGSRSRCRTQSANTVTVASGDGRVRVQMHPGSEPLLKGDYSDELTLYISPKVSG